MYEKALAYLKIKWSIIPVGENKRPIIPWKKYQTELPTEKDIEEWFKKDNPPNIGLVTGKISKVTVVDIEEGGDITDLPKTLISRTGGGGYHYFYKYKEGIGNQVRIKELTDIRSDGGYVILPPSKSTKGKYNWFNTSQPVNFPNHIFKVNKFIKPEYTKVEIPEYIGCDDGQRNDSMLRYVGKIIPLIHPLDWENTAWDKIQQANEKNNPPLEEKELRSIFDGICRNEKLNPTPRKINKKIEPIIQEEEKVDILPMWKIAEVTNIEKLETYPCGIKEFDDVMLGGFKDGDLIVVTAPTGMGKTTYAQTITYNMSNDGVPCLFFSYEVLIANIWNKFKEMGATNDHLIFSPFKTTSGTIDWLEKRVLDGVKKYGTKFIVIDHLGFLLPRKTGFDSQMNANYSAFLGNVCRDLKTLAINNKLVIMLLVHLRKTDKPTINDIRDSSGIGQESDHVFILERQLANQKSGLTEIYTNDTMISLVKNRLTGMTPKVLCHLEKGKFKKKFDME
jgi:archaellum biogenesis ATPase FlaH